MTLSKEIDEKEKIRASCLASCIYFLCMPFSIVPFLNAFSLLKLISLGIGGFLLVTMFLGKHRICLHKVHFWTVMYLLYSVTSLLFSRTHSAMETLRGMAQVYLISILMSMRVYNQREKRLLENVWLLTGFICIILGLTCTQEMGAEGRTSLKILGGWEDPNQFCAYFILPALFAAKRIITPHQKGKFLFVCYEVLLFYVLLKSGSRGGLLAVGVPILFYILVGTKGIQIKIIAVISVGLAVVLFTTVLSPLLPESITQRYSLERIEEDRGSNRLDLWEAIVSSVEQKPAILIHGGGLLYTENILTKTTYDNTVAHNQWLQVLADQGMIGVLLFLAQILAAFFYNWKNKKELASAVVGIVVLSMSLTLYTFKPYLNIILMASMTYEDDIQGESVVLHHERKEKCNA